VDEILETEKYFITAIVTASIFIFFFILYESGNSVLMESFAFSFLCLAIGFGLGGLVRATVKSKS
jgi:hypothetical protein